MIARKQAEAAALLLAAVCFVGSARASSPLVDLRSPQSSDQQKPGKQAKENHAVSLGWGGYVDTDLTFGDFFAKDHTLVARFMPQFVYSYAAPIFAENGPGNFIVGIGDYGWSKGNIDKPVAPLLFLQIGPTRQVYDLTAMEHAPPLARDAIILGDFESGSYNGWKLEGTCFGKRPATGKINDQNIVTGWRGQFFVNTYFPNDSSVGRATSAPFTITKSHLHFLIGGGRHPGRCCLNLIVGGKMVRTATGRNTEKLAPEHWDLQPLLGQTATLQIVDQEKGGWGHILVDQIVLTDSANPSLVFPGLMKEAWHHLAFVRAGNTLKLYLDGHHLVPDVVLPKKNLPEAKTTLRLGRRTTGRNIAGSGEGQFYGLIDDVGVFSRALAEEELRDLSEQRRLTGNEKGLLAGWNFDKEPKKKAAAKVMAKSATLSPMGAALVPVSPMRNLALDRTHLNMGDDRVRFQLPFPINEAWAVIQGCDESAGSHRGYAAFCWDFMLAGKAQAKSRGLALYAATDGEVVWVEQSHLFGFSKNANFVMVKPAEGIYVGYLHIAPGSFTQATGIMAAKLPQDLAEKKRPMLMAGQMVAHCGDTGAAPGAYHLHLGVTNLLDNQKQTQPFVTFPVSFVDYEASDDEGKSWHHVDRGMPKNGQWVKRLR